MFVDFGRQSVNKKEPRWYGSPDSTLDWRDKLSRTARHKSSETATYHLMNRVAGSPRFFPLQSPLAQRKLTETIRFYVSAYRYRMIAFEVLNNHYHLIVRFKKFRELTRLQLEEAADGMYGKRWKTKTKSWDWGRWLFFNRRLFNVSALMQHVNGEYAKWFNRAHGRRGHLWGDRFKNPELMDLHATQECLLYVELNALRAGLVTFARAVGGRIRALARAGQGRVLSRSFRRAVSRDPAAHLL